MIEGVSLIFRRDRKRRAVRHVPACALAPTEASSLLTVSTSLDSDSTSARLLTTSDSRRRSAARAISRSAGKTEPGVAQWTKGRMVEVALEERRRVRGRVCTGLSLL